jgi:integrase
MSIFVQAGVITMPNTTRTPTTFADIIEYLEAADSLTKIRRRDLISALRTMARFFHKEIDQVPANTEWLRQRLRQFHPRQAGVSDKHFANVKSAVIAAIKLVGVKNKRVNAFPDMSEAFQELYDAVPDRLLGYKLSRFFRFCSKQGLKPSEITDDTVNEFKATLISETLHKDPSKVAREAVLTWNKMKAVVPGWPDITLSRISARLPWTIPLEQFPKTLQSDVDAWCERLGMSDLFDEDAPVRACRPATIAHRRFQIRMMVSALVLSGIEVRSLSDLVVPDNFRQGIQFMLDRKEGKVTEALFGLASGIKAIARHYVKVGEDELNQLRRICSRLDQTADRYRKKNKERLDQFDDTRNLMLLLMLPEHLKAKSQKPGPKPRSASLLMQTAIALEILLYCPMRIGNLARLDMERHFRWITEKRQPRLIINIPADEVKNNTPLRYELCGQSVTLMRDYLDRARPLLLGAPSTAVFPRQNGRSRNPNDLSQQISRHSFDSSGLIINAHMFRSLASKIHNLVNAGDAATISHVLGDRIGTVMKSYAQFEQKNALDHYQASVNEVRDQAGNAP